MIYLYIYEYIYIKSDARVAIWRLLRELQIKTERAAI